MKLVESMKTTISLNRMEFYSYHGYYPEERKMGNSFLLDVHLNIKSFDEADDTISDTINYEDVYQICAREMANTQKLLETVVFHMIESFKSSFSNLESGEVTIQKIQPQLGGKLHSSQIKMSF